MVRNFSYFKERIFTIIKRSINLEGESESPRLDAVKWFLKNNHKSHFDQFKKFNIWTHCDLNAQKVCKWVLDFHKNKKNTNSTEPKKPRKFRGKQHSREEKIDRSNYSKIVLQFHNSTILRFWTSIIPTPQKNYFSEKS